MRSGEDTGRPGVTAGPGGDTVRPGVMAGPGVTAGPGGDTVRPGEDIKAWGNGGA